MYDYIYDYKCMIKRHTNCLFYKTGLLTTGAPAGGYISKLKLMSPTDWHIQSLKTHCDNLTQIIPLIDLMSAAYDSS